MELIDTKIYKRKIRGGQIFSVIKVNTLVKNIRIVSSHSKS
jgi:hypothetical protein